MIEKILIEVLKPNIMKIKTLFRLLTIAALVLFVIPSCVKEGPAGMDGVDGTNGTDGADGAAGADGTAFCMDCHTDSKVAEITSDWSSSNHAIGTSFAYAGGREDCSRCHSGDGFTTFIKTAAADTVTSTTPITCGACHSHGNSDIPTFQDDNGDPVYIRTTAAVSEIIDEGNTIDLGGPSNLCVNCHQARTGYPEADTDGNFAITSTHYGPHHGPQGNMIVGAVGYKFAGSVDYPATGNTATKHAEAGCVTCHMYEASDYPSHTFAPNVNACAQCHGDVTDFDIDGVQTEVTGLLTTLESKLEEKGVMASGTVVPGTYEVTLARAYYNYILCEEDRSEGVHNPDYIKALLQNTIEALQ